MVGTCRCHPRTSPPDPSSKPTTPDLDDWTTFCIKQDKGRVGSLRSLPDVHPTHRFWHLVEHGFVPGVVPGPIPDGHDWLVPKVLSWNEAAGHLGDPWLEWVVQPNGEPCTTSHFKWCPNCKGVVAVPHGCHLKTCPRCWISWANERSHAITAKVAYARRAGYTKGRPWHIMIRPPRGTVGFTWDDLAAFRAKCYKIAKRHGVRGGVCVVHWGPDKDPHQPWAPHVHMIGYLAGRYKPGPTDEGWVIKFKKIGGRDGLWKHVQRVAFYELTHCIRPPNQSHAISWFGFMANNKMPNPNPDMIAAMGLDDGDGPHCPRCSTKLVSMDTWDFTDPVSPVYVGSILDELDRPPPIITGPEKMVTHKTWTEFYDYMSSEAIDFP